MEDFLQRGCGDSSWTAWSDQVPAWMPPSLCSRRRGDRRLGGFSAGCCWHRLGSARYQARIGCSRRDRRLCRRGRRGGDGHVQAAAAMVQGVWAVIVLRPCGYAGRRRDCYKAVLQRALFSTRSAGGAIVGAGSLRPLQDISPQGRFERPWLFVRQSSCAGARSPLAGALGARCGAGFPARTSGRKPSPRHRLQ